MANPELTTKSILWFALRAMLLFAFVLTGWSFAVRTYTAVPAEGGNRILHALGVDSVTTLGSSRDSTYDIAVYHRDAAGKADSLFDFKLEALHTDIPMLAALVLAMPFPWRRRIIALSIGIILLAVAESAACVLVMSWSYLFLPDHHTFSPFHPGSLGTAAVNLLYSAYNTFGPAVLPILTWIVVAVRKRDFSSQKSKEPKEK